MFMQNDVEAKSRQNFERVLEVVAGDMATIRTGRAKPDLVSNIEVLAYGSRMKLFEVANINAPDINLITVQPWDKSLIKDIEKALAESELKLPVAVSGEMIRIVIPQLTEERRKDFVKLLHQKMESAKIMLRQARQEIKDDIDRSEGQPGVSEDDIKHQLEQLQKMTDEYMVKIEEMARKKEAEIMMI